MKIERIENGNFADIVVNLFNKAEKSIDMSTSLFPQFYNNDKVRNALEDCAKRVLSFRILLDKDVDIEKTRKEVPWIFDLQRNGFVSIAKAQDEIEHYIIRDNKDLRIEEKHALDEPGKRNVIVYDAPIDIILFFKNRFDKWWERSSNLQLEK